MAGDWMKIELELPDKPEVHSMAGILNMDPDCIVGKLIRVWQWFDKHTTDGNAFGVTYSLPDRITGVTGFGEAMSFVGWLEQKDKNLHMPKFDRHTSESAKKRAQTAKRVAKSRTSADSKCNADSVTKSVTEALPREEKRREDKEHKTITTDVVTDIKSDMFNRAKEIGVKGSMVGMAIKEIGEIEAMAALEQCAGLESPTNAFAASIRNRKARIVQAEKAAIPIVFDPSSLSI